MRHFSAVELHWNGLTLHLGSGRILATIIPDPDWPKMYRVQMPGQKLSDMVNLTRAKDAAVHLALMGLNTVKAAA